MFGKKKPKKVAIGNGTEEIAIDFIKRAVGSINGQINLEIERNGFNIKDVKSGKIELKRTLITSEKNPLFKTETFTIKTPKFERAILAVRWSPNSYIIERNSDAAATAIKLNPVFGIKKGANTSKLILNATRREVEIEARAAEIKKEYIQKQKI